MATRKVLKLPRAIRPDETAKHTVTLTNEAYCRLSFHAARRGVNNSALLEQLIRGHLSPLRVDDSGRAPAQGAAVA
jgi:hypothetical protein